MKNIILLLGVFFLMSCSEKTKKQDFEEVWYFKEFDAQKLISECVDSVFYLPLQLNQDAMFRNIDKMVVENDLVYIGDFRTRKIVAFNMKGEIQFVLNRLGSGAGEYQEIKSFTVMNESLYILDNYRRKVYIYDAFTGKYKDKKELPIVAWDIEALSDDRFLLAFVPIRQSLLAEEQDCNLVFLSDGDFKIIGKFLPFDEGYSEPYGFTRYFTTYGDSVFFTSYNFDGVTVFSKSKPGEHFQIGIEFKNKLSEAERLDAEKLEMSAANYLGSTPFFCGEYVALDMMEEGYGYTCMYNREDSSFYSNPLEENGDWFNALLSPIGSYKNLFISEISDYGFYQDLVGSGFKKADATVENHLKNGDCVLLFYAMK